MAIRVRPVVCALVASAAFVGLSVGSVAGAATPPSVWTPVTTLVGSAYAQGGENSVLESAVVAMPQGGATAVWGEHSVLKAVTRSPGSGVWSAPETVTTNGEFEYNYEGTAPSLAVSPAGQVSVAWMAPGDSPSYNKIDVSTRATLSSGWSAPTQVSTSGAGSNAPQLTYGSDGTAALTWENRDGIYAAVLAPGAGIWSEPVLVSDPVNTNVLPAVQLPHVAVASDGDVTLTWAAYEQNPIGLNYRLRTSTRSAATEAWSAPAWLSADGVDAMSVHLVAATDGTVAASWTDNLGAQVSIHSGAGWSTPTDVTGPDSYNPALVARPDGSVTAVWISAASGHNQILAANHTRNGWATPVTIDTNPTNDGIGTPVLTTDAAGDVTASWLHLGSSSTVLQSSTQVGASPWTLPATDATHTTNLADFVIAEDPAGFRSLVVDDQVRQQATPTLGQYALEATATITPTLAPASAPRISGTPAVGHRLTAASGSWSPKASSVSYQWCRNATPIRGATGRTYVPVIADAAHKITVTITAHRAGYHNGAATSAAVTVPRPTMTNTARPTISGHPHVKTLLKAHPGRWLPTATKYTYQWLRNGKAIRGAIHSTYRVVKTDRHRAVSVRITATRSGYTPAARSSRSLHIA